MRHFLFAVTLGVCISGVELLPSRAPIIMIPLTFAGLYVAAVTAAHDEHTAIVSIVRGALLGSLSIASAIAFLAIIIFASERLPDLGIPKPPDSTLASVLGIGSLVIGFWFLLGVLLRTFRGE